MADPTVTVVFNQLVLVNGKLDQVQLNTSLIANLNSSINQGFNDTVDTLNVLIKVNIEAVKLLYHQTKQADTMICYLDQISQNTCNILTQVAIQTDLQTRLQKDVDALLYISESVNAAVAVERQRHDELRAQIERCCPPPPLQPVCTFKPCDKPEPVKEPELTKFPDDHKPVG